MQCKWKQFGATVVSVLCTGVHWCLSAWCTGVYWCLCGKTSDSWNPNHVFCPTAAGPAPLPSQTTQNNKQVRQNNQHTDFIKWRQFLTAPIGSSSSDETTFCCVLCCVYWSNESCLFWSEIGQNAGMEWSDQWPWWSIGKYPGSWNYLESTDHLMFQI